MLCRRIGQKLLTNKSLNELNSIIFKNKRLVQTTNVHEIDYLVKRFRLTNNCSIGSGLHSSLAYFNTIDDFSYKTDKELTNDSLKTLLNINKSEANALIRKYPVLTEHSVDVLAKQLKYLSTKYLLTTLQIVNCPWILYLPLNFINERLESLQEIGITDDHLVLLLFPFNSFKRILKKIDSKNLSEEENGRIFEDLNRRLNLFSENLNLTHEELCDIIHDNMFLFYYEFERLETVMNLLLNAGIDPEIIVSDITVFRHNIEIMKERLENCKRHNMQIKTWMLRSTQESFDVTLRRHIDNKNALKHHENNIELLAAKLNCNKEIIYLICRRHPRIITINPKKLSKIITYLLENGFNAYHIIDTPKILFHSLETIKKRMKQLSEINVKANALNIMLISEDQFNKLINELKSIQSDQNDRSRSSLL